jgi:DNA-binding transcriptional MerR regulator
VSDARTEPLLSAKPETKRSKDAYMISAVAEQYQIHPQTLRLYTDQDLERMEEMQLQIEMRRPKKSGV